MEDYKYTIYVYLAFILILIINALISSAINITFFGWYPKFIYILNHRV